MTMTMGETTSRADARDGRYLAIEGISKRFGSAIVLDKLDASIDRGEFISLLGPSGCGKTTLLRVIAGLLSPDTGSVSVGGKDITRVPAHKRNIGVVFQSYALFPHLNVAENVAFGLEAQGTAKSEIGERVGQALSLVRMDAYADRRISELSGGQQQRIAVARALVVRPTLLLLDEPFSALDRNLRETMQIELRDLLRQQNITSIFVTHDQEEALVMSDRIAVMNAGRVEHFGTPTEIYRHPQTPFVLEFVGQSTRLAGRVTQADAEGLLVETSVGPIRAPGALPLGTQVIVGVRPELVDVGSNSPEGGNTLSLELADAVYLGSKTMLYFNAPERGDRILAEVPRLTQMPTRGTRLDVSWPVCETVVFPWP